MVIVSRLPDGNAVKAFPFLVRVMVVLALPVTDQVNTVAAVDKLNVDVPPDVTVVPRMPFALENVKVATLVAGEQETANVAGSKETVDQ